MTDLWEVDVTCPDADTAAAIAHACVAERLAACAQVWPGLRSLYRWQGAIADDPEVALRLKTTSARFEALAARIRALHPYEVPAIQAVAVVAATPDFADWVRAETTPTAADPGDGNAPA